MSWLAALLLLQPATIGVWQGWGAFRDAERCWAIAAPPGRRSSDAFASVSSWPARGLRDQVQFRLSRDRRADAPVVLAVGDRRFRLVARGRDAWGAEPGADRAILAALRTARAMAVESRDATGRRFVDGYPLGGAPTAIDAARIACR